MKTFPYTPSQCTWLTCLETTTLPQTASGHLWKETPSHPTPHTTHQTPGTRAYCCLGIAYMLFDPSADSMRPFSEFLTNSKGRDLTPALQDKLHLRSQTGAHKNKKISLSLLNDTNHTFAEIASTIRQNPTDFFTN